MIRLDLVMMCVVAVIFLLRVLVGLLKEWMVPAAQPRKMPVAQVYPSRKPAELVVIPVDPAKRPFPRKIGERMALLLLVAAGMAISLHLG
jgi:hypothetical protein